ncbi:restriction endonuclease subunit S [Pseudomonas sediminis]|uniref:restriction endonuclease subunit S n=1 Tax=Pseudomonas sediminis TaxID=1691904 RepID=UPI002448FD7E|nr:restriction endonuclease subunit S [Pseudomonas sediminis]MDG9759554.1 restriction endonuclease subunit S [Pseudomonas sediminis]
MANNLLSNWRRMTLDEICSGNLQTGPFGSQLKAEQYSDEGIPVFMPKDLVSNRATRESAAKISPETAKNLSKHRLIEGDILFSRRGDVARYALIDKAASGGICGTGCLRARPDDIYDSLFISYALQQDTIKDWLTDNAVGQTMLNLNTTILSALPLDIPPRAEQTKIAQILATWDKAIATTERLLANSQQQKQALLEPLLSGRKRFAGYPAWTRTAFAQLLTESRLPGSNGEIAKKITVKLYGKGVFAKDEKRIGSESTKYYRRRSGQFIYSKLDFLNGAFGIIPEHLDGYESTLDLPAFDFSELVEPAWLLQYVSREEFYTAQLGLANGGRKARRVNPADLLGIEIPLPSRPEQQKIAQVLSTADAEIANLQAQLDKLKLEKKALMQQLLTGKRRVRLDDEEEDLAPIRRVG